MAYDFQLEDPNIFFPYAQERMRALRASENFLCHYTSAEAAIKILRSKEVWLRSSRVMNDVSEVKHGHSCLKAAWDDDNVGGRLRSLLAEISPHLSNEVEKGYNAQIEDRNAESYIISLSEMASNLDKNLGRLSMWRAYGGETSVALVFYSAAFIAKVNPFNAFTSPVLYADENIVKTKFLQIVTNLESIRQSLKIADPMKIRDHLVSAFHYAVLSTKHPGFEEEMEWRIIYSPTIWRSTRLTTEIVIVSGTPQRVHKLPFVDLPDENHFGSLQAMLRAVVVGPTAHSYSIRQAMISELNDCGVQNPESKVVASNIPLRRS